MSPSRKHAEATLTMTNRPDPSTQFGAVARFADNALVRDLVAQIPTGFVMAEAPTGRIVVFNDEAARILGHPLIPADDVEAYARYGAVHDDGSPYRPEEHPLARALGGRFLHGERVRYRRGDGVTVTLSVNAGPLHDEKGRVAAAVLTMSDVTHERLAEERLRSRLETLVAQRTEELVRRTAELDRANAALRALSESLEATVRSRTEELEVSRARLAHDAQHDGLTGLPNRVRLEERLERALLAARRNGGRLAVMFLDLDGFKEVNDRHGHAVGDAALRQIAERLQEQLRPQDMLARLGGDEFVVLIDDLDHGASEEQGDAGDVLPEAVAAAELAARLLQALGEPIDVSGEPLRLSLSIGVTLFPEDGSDAVTLQRRADAAMYRAKGGGGNRVEFFDVAVTRVRGRGSS
jgi:diguanylate cyclase (GGDEF)-like protein/PAS domain S-box-containing protein